MKINQLKRIQQVIGFTLLEILIALFVFSMLSFMLMSALRVVMQSDSETEKKAQRMRALQMPMVLLGREITQIINRSVTDRFGKEIPAFVGNETGFMFTHGGAAQTLSADKQSDLQRKEYTWHNQALWVKSFAMLDEVGKSKTTEKKFLDQVNYIEIKYYDKNGKAYSEWPANDDEVVFPHAISLLVNLAKWGDLNFIYVIANEIPIHVALPTS